MAEDHWAHFYYENPAKEESEDDDFNLEAELADADAIVAAATVVNENPNDWEDI